MTLLSCVEIEPHVPAKYSVVWLHGLGADGHDFEPIVPELRLDDLAFRFVFPHAPAIPVTLNGGYVMPAWYDITDLDLKRRHDLAGVKRSAERISDIIQREEDRGIPSDHIFLAGFSQGGAIALYLGTRFPRRLAGILALSTYLVDSENVPSASDSPNGTTPIFQAHGVADPMVTPDRGRAARDHMQSLGYDLEWHEYPMQHSVCPREITDIAAFLRRSGK